MLNEKVEKRESQREWNWVEKVERRWKGKDRKLRTALLMDKDDNNNNNNKMRYKPWRWIL